MKILLVNFGDSSGGSSIACFRLTNALNKCGIQATFAVVDKKTSSPFVVKIPCIKQTKLRTYCKRFFCLILRVVKKCFPFLFDLFEFKTSNESSHSINNESIADVNWINGFDCDVVNLHWVAANMLSIKDIAKINKPIVWTLHDSWPFCGAEHHPNVLENDNRYTMAYTRKNKPLTTKGLDICRKVWLQKKKYLSNKNILFISPSNWERVCLKQSSLFSAHKCFTIPNVIPNEVFKPRDKKIIRILLGIPDNKKIIGFGASYDINNPKGIKGSYFLLEAFKKLEHNEDYFFVVFGDVKDEFASRITIPYFSAGFISNENILAILYNSLDVFVCPSIVENLSTTMVESMFSGVPSIAFNTGGNSDIIMHKVNGYLAESYDTDDLAHGIEWCIENSKKLSKNCLEKAKKDFDEKQIVKQYIDIYSMALKESDDKNK